MGIKQEGVLTYDTLAAFEAEIAAKAIKSTDGAVVHLESEGRGGRDFRLNQNSSLVAFPGYVITPQATTAPAFPNAKWEAVDFPAVQWSAPVDVVVAYSELPHNTSEPVAVTVAGIGTDAFVDVSPAGDLPEGVSVKYKRTTTTTGGVTTPTADSLTFEVVNTSDAVLPAGSLTFKVMYGTPTA